jgi:uncharacterized protein YcfJ
MAVATPTRAESVQDHYKDVIMKQPYSVEVCNQHNGNGKSEIQNFLEGAIIGGAIGNNIPGEKNGGAMGAFLGGVLNNENNKNRGPRCYTETRYNEERQRVYSHSTITFYHDGRQYTLRFQK